MCMQQQVFSNIRYIFNSPVPRWSVTTLCDNNVFVCKWLGVKWAFRCLSYHTAPPFQFQILFMHCTYLCAHVKYKKKTQWKSTGVMQRDNFNQGCEYEAKKSVNDIMESKIQKYLKLEMKMV